MGEWETVDGEISMCARGLHASVDVLDALFYAPGTIVRRVQLAGEIITDNDKVVCSRRRTLWAYDADAVLRHWSRLCALDVIHLWEAPPIVVSYLRTGDESLRASAWASAWASARASAREAAMTAARAADPSGLWEAARVAAWEAVREAAMAAAWEAAREAARASAREAAGASAVDVVVTTSGLWASAWASAREAARAKQSRRLVRMLRNGRRA